MKITFDNRSSSSDTLEETGKKILQTILEKGIYEEIELDVTDDNSGRVTRYVISVDATYNDNQTDLNEIDLKKKIDAKIHGNAFIVKEKRYKAKEVDINYDFHEGRGEDNELL